MLFKNLILFTVGIAGGITVGSATAAFITLLDIIPRLAQLSNSSNYITLYEKTVIISVVFITFMTILKIPFHLNKLLLIPIGLMMGIFIGLLAAALAEVVNVIPVLARRLNADDYIHLILISTALGKVAGSIIQWIFLVNID